MFIVKFILWFVSTKKKKKLILSILDSIVQSEDDTIDNSTATQIIEYVAKSSGNKITAYILKD